MTRAARAMAMFGVDAAQERAQLDALRGRCGDVAAQIDAALRAGEVALLSGMSGSGKSTALSALCELVRQRGECVVLCSIEESGPNAPIVERVGGTAGEAMRLLAAAGLGEAGLLGRGEGALSAGQQARLRLAVAMDRAQRAAAAGGGGAGEGGARVTLVVDEFASGLDEPTARCLAHSFAKWVRADGRFRAVVAGSRADAGALGAEVEASACSGIVRRRPAREVGRAELAINIEIGVTADYVLLSHYHYAGDRPGPICRVLRAHDDASGALAGVLVVSRPALNARWRRLAWPGRYDDRDLRARALRLNAEVRVISRLIVDPRFRACGVGTRLVRAYLSDPLTPATEAISAMGEACPLFERAGMRPIRMAQRPQDGRLERFLAARKCSPERLAEESAVEELWGDDEAKMELRRWAGAARRTRRLLESPPRELCRQAARALLAEPVAYVAMQGGDGEIELKRLD